MTIPDWIKYDAETHNYWTSLDACRCERCQFTWYPRIQAAVIKLKICPKCKSKLWNITKE